MINGLPATSEKISMVSSFIQQDYLFFGTLTGILNIKNQFQFF